MNYFPNPLKAIACCLTLFASGCASSSVDTSGPGLELPPKPAFMRPVAVPDVDRSAVTTIARFGGALKEANGRLTKSGTWYEENVRKPYSGAKKEGAAMT